uniref:(northern house mosquito) hypothetical protein n=1 Tax=Culex pipiens TaxID=7175 RepID=A0A8D8HP72_CULPI
MDLLAVNRFVPFDNCRTDSDAAWCLLTWHGRSLICCCLMNLLITWTWRPLTRWPKLSTISRGGLYSLATISDLSTRSRTKFGFARMAKSQNGTVTSWTIRST